MSPLSFADHKPLVNPFNHIVADPLGDDVDVEEINRRAFEACKQLVQGVRASHASGALTLFGEPGSGKTHLLARVRRWLQSDPGSLFVPVRMDTSARMLWRHLRRNLADALLRSEPSGQPALDRLLRPKRHELAAVTERDLAVVLENLLDGGHARDSAAWLRGQELPEQVLHRMELAQPGPYEDQEVRSRDILRALCELIAPGVVVFCLDQWEALEGLSHETDGLIAAGQAVSILHAPPIRNVCIVACVQVSLISRLENLLDVAIQHRLLARKQNIEPLDWDLARKLISARLDQIPELAARRREAPDSAWPLSETEIRKVFTANAAPARMVIARCKDLFDLWQFGKCEPPEPIDKALQRMLDERTVLIAPEDAEPALRNGLPLVLRTQAHAAGPFDFSLPKDKTQIALCTQSNATSLAVRVRKIDDSFEAGRLFLLRDARLPIGPRADKTRQRLASIQRKGGQLIPVSQEAIAALAALKRLLADAQSGDLAHNGDSVATTKVEQWIANHIPAALDPLLAEIQQPDPLSGRLAVLLADRKIVGLDDAAQELESQASEVESCARRDPRVFGLLEGSRSVLFQIVESDSVS